MQTLEQLIHQYKSDNESVYNTWFVNNEERLKDQVRRDLEGFPENFLFQLSQDEFAALTSQIAMSKRGRGGRRACQRAPS